MKFGLPLFFLLLGNADVFNSMYIKIPYPTCIKVFLYVRYKHPPP